jgi:hypothetical protein
MDLKQSKALVCEWEDGAIEVYYRGDRVAFIELKEPYEKPLGPFRSLDIQQKISKKFP